MSSSINLESQAAQLLVQLHVSSNPAFVEQDGFHDEELLMRADALGVAAQGKAEAEKRQLASMDSNRSLLSAASSSPSPGGRSGGRGGGGGGEDSVVFVGNASFEIEQFRAALRQQRAPSLRLLTSVSRTAIPALMCVICNAQNADTVDDFCRGGRFDSLYYDAKFKTARQNEKRKELAKKAKFEEKRHCTFAPHKKAQIAEQFLAFKRGIVAPGEVYFPPVADDGPTAAAATEEGGEKKEGGDAAAEGDGDKNKAAAAAAAAADDSDPLEACVVLEPDAFFKHAMEWKKHKERKLEKKVQKLLKDQAEEDEEVFRPWKMLEESRQLAAVYKQKEKAGLLPHKTQAQQYSFKPQTTPFRSQRRFLDTDDVLERMQIDATRRKDAQLHREIDAISKIRAHTPRLGTSQVESRVRELYQPTPKKTPTFRKKVPFDEPTFSPQIHQFSSGGSRATSNSTSATSAGTGGGGRGRSTRRGTTPPAGSRSTNRHAQCLVDWEAEILSKAVPVGSPMSPAEATDRFHEDEESMVDREQRLQQLRDRAEKKKLAECTFQPSLTCGASERRVQQHADASSVSAVSAGTPPPVSPSSNLAARFYGSLEDELMNQTASLVRKVEIASNNNKQMRSGGSDRALSSSSASPRRKTPTSASASPSRRTTMHFRTSNPVSGVVPLSQTTASSSSASPPRPAAAAAAAAAASSPPGVSPHRRRGQLDEYSPDSRVRRADFSPPRMKVTPPPAAPSAASPPTHVHGRVVDLNAEFRHSPTRLRQSAEQQQQQQQQRQGGTTFPRAHVGLMRFLSESFHSELQKRGGHGGVLLSLTAAIELVHRIAIQQRITVKRLLNWEDASCIFASKVPFPDFVRLFELCVGVSVRDHEEKQHVAVEKNELDL